MVKSVKARDGDPAFQTTTKHLAWFAAAVMKWQKLLGLTNYGIHIYHCKLDDFVLADCKASMEGHAGISLNVVWTKKPTRKRIESTAAHEVFHILLNEMSELAYSRDFDAEDFDRAEEYAVRRLEFMVAEL